MTDCGKLRRPPKLTHMTEDVLLTFSFESPSENARLRLFGPQRRDQHHPGDLALKRVMVAL